MDGVTAEIAAYAAPGGRVSPIAGQIAHNIIGVDFFLVNSIGGREPLLSTTFAERGVVSEPPPNESEWISWGNRVEVELEAMREYTDAVYAAVDDILQAMDDADLEVEKDFGALGKQTVGWAFSLMLLDIFCHTGEISCLKGIQGLKGYPM